MGGQKILMSEKKLQNSVRFVGYLQETTLEEKVSQKGRKFITGNVVVAVDEFNKHKVRFIIFEDQGKERYEAISKFLPDNVISVASYLKSTPTATFAVASNMAAKIWIAAEFEEFVSRSGEKERTGVTLKGNSMGYCDENKKFVPDATFEVDTYIDSLVEEVEEEKETGRLIVNTIIPDYKGLAYRVDFIAPVEDNTAKFLREKYHSGDFAHLKGNLVAMRVNIATEVEELEDSFGGGSTQQYTTRFVRERRIKGGNRIEAFLTAEQVKQGLALREVEMDKNGQRRAAAAAAREEGSTATAEEPTPAPAPVKPVANANDFDF